MAVLMTIATWSISSERVNDGDDDDDHDDDDHDDDDDVDNGNLVNKFREC